jgi:hypothetical protein
MWAKTANVSEVEVSGAAKEISRPVAWGKRDAPPVCCGKPMEPRLAHGHDRFGQTLLVAVWQCPLCGRVIY